MFVPVENLMGYSEAHGRLAAPAFVQVVEVTATGAQTKTLPAPISGRPGKGAWLISCWIRTQSAGVIALTLKKNTTTIGVGATSATDDGLTMLSTLDLDLSKFIVPGDVLKVDVGGAKVFDLILLWVWLD